MAKWKGPSGTHRLRVRRRLPEFKARGFSEGETSYPPALVELCGPGAAVMGFIMEEHQNDQVTVYVPSAPVLTVGNTFVVERQRVTPLNASAKEVADCISQWGVRSENIVQGLGEGSGTLANSK